MVHGLLTHMVLIESFIVVVNVYQAQIAELQSMLEALPSVEAEVQSLRKEKFTI